jgi:hypothetical protein
VVVEEGWPMGALFEELEARELPPVTRWRSLRVNSLI